MFRSGKVNHASNLNQGREGTKTGREDGVTASSTGGRKNSGSGEAARELGIWSRWEGFTHGEDEADVLSPFLCMFVIAALPAYCLLALRLSALARTHSPNCSDHRSPSWKVFHPMCRAGYHWTGHNSISGCEEDSVSQFCSFPLSQVSKDGTSLSPLFPTNRNQIGSLQNCPNVAYKSPSCFPCFESPKGQRFSIWDPWKYPCSCWSRNSWRQQWESQTHLAIISENQVIWQKVPYPQPGWKFYLTLWWLLLMDELILIPLLPILMFDAQSWKVSIPWYGPRKAGGALCPT